MSDRLSPAARALVRAARRAEAPTPADQARVRAAVARRLAASVAVAATTEEAMAAGALPAGATAGAAGSGVSVAAKLVAGLALVGAVTAGGTSVLHHRQRLTTRVTRPAATLALVPSPPHPAPVPETTPAAPRLPATMRLMPSRKAAVQPAADWRCPFPRGSGGIEARVSLIVAVRPDGTPVVARALNDPGHGFAAAAEACAMSHAFSAARDPRGRPTWGETPPFTVLFLR
jgi:hypothetical protein